MDQAHLDKKRPTAPKCGTLALSRVTGYRLILSYMLIVAFILLGTASTQAQTELEKFVATMPPQAGFAFRGYNSCSLFTASRARQAGSDKRQTTSFEEIEAAIAETCKKDLSAVERQLAQLGMSAPKRAKLIERLTSLALAERRLRYDGKPIPGSRVERIRKCSDKAAIKALDDCMMEQAKTLMQSSTEQLENIAVAADNACQGAQTNLIQQLALCMTVEKARNVVRELVDSWRSRVVTEVVRERADGIRHRPELDGPRATPPKQ